MSDEALKQMKRPIVFGSEFLSWALIRLQWAHPKDSLIRGTCQEMHLQSRAADIRDAMHPDVFGRPIGPTDRL